MCRGEAAIERKEGESLHIETNSRIDSADGFLYRIGSGRPLYNIY